MAIGDYSLSDISAVTGGSGFGGMGGWGGLILGFLGGALFSGGGLFGGYGNQRGNVATTEDLASGFNFSALQGKTNDILAAVNGVNQNIGNAVCSSTYELASKIDQCCCNTQLGVQQVRYDMAVQNGDLKALIHSEGEATRSMLQQNKIESLQAQVNQLQLAQATCGLPRISPYGYGVYAYPTCQTGCGCNGAY